MPKQLHVITMKTKLEILLADVNYLDHGGTFYYYDKEDNETHTLELVRLDTDITDATLTRYVDMRLKPKSHTENSPYKYLLTYRVFDCVLSEDEMMLETHHRCEEEYVLSTSILRLSDYFNVKFP